MPRPIEMHAHDPVRFVSDMYAWIHQNVAEERDFFMNLLDTVSDAEGKQMKLVPGRNNQEYSMDNNDIDNDNFNSNFMGDKVNSSLHDKYGNDKNASNDDNGNTGDYTAGVGTQRDNETIHVQVDQSDKLLAQVMEGVSRPLKLRVEQALQTQPTPLITFKLLNVTTFYRDTIRALLSPGAELSACLEELVELAGHTFFHLVEKVNNKMLTSPPQYTLDLSPPKVVTEQINRLDMLMRAYKKSLISSTQKDRDFAPVLSGTNYT